jgi:hypothetical protein
VALAAYLSGKYDGLGFALHVRPGENAEVLIAVDLDHCRNPKTGVIDDWARKIIDALNSYTEISPSGEGIRILLRGRLPQHGRKRRNFECYCDKRYVTVTGQHIAGTPLAIESRSAEILAVHKQLWPEHHQPKINASAQPTVGTAADLSDLELVEKAKKAKNGAKFTALWNGDTSGYSSASEADLALCSYLAFWCGPNSSDRIDALFRQSGLFRSKWNRPDYREQTLQRALDGRTDFYEPRGNGFRSNNGPQQGAGQTSAEAKSFQLGSLTLRPGKPRQTASGKISVPVATWKDGMAVYPFSLSTTASSRKEARRVLSSQFLKEDAEASEKIDSTLISILAWAGEELQKNPATNAGPTIREIVKKSVPDDWCLTHRVDRGAWSEARQDVVTRSDFVSYTPNALLEAAAGAADVPRDEQGRASRVDLLRLVETELKILWADLIAGLPLARDADLPATSAAAAAFRNAIIRLWTRTQTFEVVKAKENSTTDVASRASLISRVHSQVTRFRHEVRHERPRWIPIQHAFDAWWRPWIDVEGNENILLAMRWRLVEQAGVQLPGVVDQESLTELGKRFGVLQDPPPGIPAVLSGGKARLGVLSLSLAQELIEEPMEAPETNPREPGE